MFMVPLFYSLKKFLNGLYFVLHKSVPNSSVTSFGN